MCSTVPPRTWKHWPLIQLAAGEARYAAISATWTGSVGSNASSVRAAFRSTRHPMVARRVRAEGMIAFEVTPYGAISVAIASVKARTPAFAAT
jgi:hypothetical protein